MFQRTFHQFQIAEARDLVPRGSAFKLTLAACQEAAAAGFYKAYYSPSEWGKAMESARKDEKDAAEIVGSLTEAYLSDLSSTRSVLRAGLQEAHVTTDFPIALAGLRQRTLREGYTPSDSMLPSLAESRPVSNFRLISGVNLSNFDDLEPQAEGEDVTYGTFSETEDGYKVRLLSKAVRFTYQMWKNDDFGLIMRIMKRGGEAARRARALAVADAIKKGLTRQTLGGPGGPDPTRLEAAIQFQADLKSAEGRANPRRVTDLILPIKWQMMANTTLHSQELFRTQDKSPRANPVYEAATPHVDEMWSERLGLDWLVYDANRPFCEMAVLDDFESGPRTVTKLPDVGEFPESGSFSNNSIEVKFMDAVAAHVFDTQNALLVAGE